MNTLADAWTWYECNRRQLKLIQRVGRKFPSALSADTVARDEQVQDWSRTIAADTDAALEPLDDLAVLVLFSVFEAVVRQELLIQIGKEVGDSSHPIVRNAIRDAIQGIENGSFYNNVLQPFKLPADADKELIEHVNQVRKYRNFVAHGKRGKPAEAVTPEVAYERLKKFLQVIGVSSA